MLAAADLGATIVPMSNSLGQKDLLTAIKLTGIKFLIGRHLTLKNIFVVRFWSTSRTKQDRLFR